MKTLLQALFWVGVYLVLAAAKSTHKKTNGIGILKNASSLTEGI